jgi:hypothetical protein
MENRVDFKYVNIPANNIPASNIIPANNINNTNNNNNSIQFSAFI